MFSQAPPSQCHPSGAVTNPSQSAGGIDREDLHQMTDAYRTPGQMNINAALHPSPLFVGNHVLPQPDDVFSRGLDTTKRPVEKYTPGSFPEFHDGRARLPSPHQSPDLGRDHHGQYPSHMHGSGQQTPAPLIRPAVPNYSSNSGSEPSSRSQSQVPSGGGSHEGFQQIYSAYHQQPATPRMDPYLQTHNTLEGQIQDLNSTIARLVADVARLNESNQHLSESIQRTCLINAQMSVTNDALTAQVNGLDEIVKTLQAESKKPQKKVTGKHISNDHPALKRLIQPMFCDLCGVESSMGRNKRTEALMKVKPLGNGHAYEMHQGEEGDKQGEEGGGKTWHPNWLGHVDEVVNAMFIKEIIDRVYNNEKCRRESPNLKAEVPDEDFNMRVIIQCMKDYFRNIHKQAMCRSDASKAQKAEQKKEHGRQRARRAAVTKSRRATAVIYEKETGREGVVAMIDTDFASDVLSYSEDDLSEDTLTRWAKSGAGNSANMVVGLEWRSIDYVAFLRFLTLRQMKGNNRPTTADIDETSTIQPPKKCCKTAEGGTRSKRIVKKTFDISPEQMNDDAHLPKKTCRLKTWLQTAGGIAIWTWRCLREFRGSRDSGLH
ncbi:hypothetical protein EV702DRAFT_1200579 [Suillus placidus]|uniref:Uncharacterized protein n=1 Tax=Suillus placidus TaxID=48579 RepID=A0A9P7D0S8_9AGAM|nr:hypothetical protein EV702DRAFT_1200579 [Suillus placidus]